jgi:acetyl esterase
VRGLPNFVGFRWSTAREAAAVLVEHDEHMPLDPAARALIDVMNAVFPRLDEAKDGDEARASVAAAMAGMPVAEPDPIHHVEDRTIAVDGGQITVRVYRPTTDQGAPVVVFFHGGGWVLCDLDSHDGTCRRIANDSGCVVVATDYRRAPEFRFPVPVEDCYSALLWAHAHASEIGGDPDRFAVFGDSAGGNVAAAVAQMTRDRGGPELKLQILAYPVIDARCDTASHKRFGRELNLTSSEVKWCWDQYLASEADGANPYASPIRAESLAGLAPALVISPEYDPLCDEGAAYAAALTAAGVPTTYSLYPGMIHSLLAFSAALPPAEQAFAEIAGALAKAF